jgi:hypothetical protein
VEVTRDIKTMLKLCQQLALWGICPVVQQHLLTFLFFLRLKNCMVA